jgi:hypothetical protein
LNTLNGPLEHPFVRNQSGKPHGGTNGAGSVMRGAAAGIVGLLKELLPKFILLVEVSVLRVRVVQLLLDFVVMVATSKTTECASKHVDISGLF